MPTYTRPWRRQNYTGDVYVAYVNRATELI